MPEKRHMLSMPLKIDAEWYQRMVRIMEYDGHTVRSEFIRGIVKRYVMKREHEIRKEREAEAKKQEPRPER